MPTGSSFTSGLVVCRFSSRFSEYVFQALRSATQTSTYVSEMQVPHIFRSLLRVSGMEAGPEGAMNPMKSRRGMLSSCKSSIAS